jgi:hypothetical protein
MLFNFGIKPSFQTSPFPQGRQYASALLMDGKIIVYDKSQADSFKFALFFCPARKRR